MGVLRVARRGDQIFIGAGLAAVILLGFWQMFGGFDAATPTATKERPIDPRIVKLTEDWQRGEDNLQAKKKVLTDFLDARSKASFEAYTKAVRELPPAGTGD